MNNEECQTSQDSQVKLARRYFNELSDNAGEIYNSVEDFAKTFLYDVVQRAENIPEDNHKDDQVIKYVTVAEKDTFQKFDENVQETYNKNKDDVNGVLDDNQKNIEQAKIDELNYQKLREEKLKNNKNIGNNFYENIKDKAFQKLDLSKKTANDYYLSTSQRALAKHSNNCCLVKNHYADLYDSALKNISESSVRPEILESQVQNNKTHVIYSKGCIDEVSNKLEEGIDQIDKIVKEKQTNVSNEFNSVIRLSYDFEKLT